MTALEVGTNFGRHTTTNEVWMRKLYRALPGFCNPLAGNRN
jgi:hypothetical protein